MQTVILAGGKGTRLRPFTNDLPKPMVHVNGKPFLHHLLDYTSSFNLKNIVLLVGYMSDRIEDYFKDGSQMDLSIKYSKEDSLLGTGGALKKAEKMLNDEFILINGDTYLLVDYSDLIKSFHANRTISTIVVYLNDDGEMRNNIRVNGSGLIVGYSKKSSRGLSHVDAGAIVLKKEALDYIPDDRICSLEEEIFKRLIDMREMSAYVTRNRFYDMGSMEGIGAIKEILR